MDYTTKIVYSKDDIRRKIAEENPQIVHICGHGLENGYLKLENDESGISPEVLKFICKQHKHTIKCVLLNACHSEKATLEISQNINYAIGMNNRIIDNVAIEFAKGFYDGLGYSNDHNRYVTAFNEGITAVIAKNKSQESIPVLKTRISYEQAIYNLLKNLDAENKINHFITKLKNHNYTNRLLRKFISYYEYRLKEDELHKFKRIINVIVDDSAIQGAYGKIFPNDIELDKNKIIDKLIENDGTKSDIPLIVEFANHLALILKSKKNPQSEKIKAWVDSVSNRLGIRIPASDENESNQKIINTYLLIIVDDEGNNKFNLRAEYILEDGNSQIVKQESLNMPEYNQKTGINCNSFNEISHHVKKYHDRLYSQLSGNELKNITIELFLPIQYLKNNLDKEWFCDDDFDGKTPIVRECNIVVRSSNRINNKKFGILLENNFKRFKDNLSKYSDEDIINKEIEIIHQKVVDSNFQEISENFKDKKVGVKSNHDSVPQTAFFKAILRGAVVIAFWIRDSNHADSRLYDIDRYLKLEFLNNNFRDLIKKMYELRKKASYSDGNYYPIGFLCDNPHRIPKSEPLKPIS